MMAELEAMGGEEFKFDAVARVQELTQESTEFKRSALAAKKAGNTDQALA